MQINRLGAPVKHGHVLTGSNDTVEANGILTTPSKACINASAAGANVVVAAIPGKVIRVLQYVLVCAGDVAVSWESSGGTVLAGPLPFAQNGGAAPPFNAVGHFDTLPGEDLVLYLGGTVHVGGHLSFLAL